MNVDCPMALLPATIAHELAHQRGVAGEDEANFVAVAACLADGDPTFVYSGALMAYVYLGNGRSESPALKLREKAFPPKLHQAVRTLSFSPRQWIVRPFQLTSHSAS